MATAEEIAQQQADRRLARSGLKPDGTPIEDGIDDESAEQEAARLLAEAEALAGGDPGDDGSDGGDVGGDDTRSQEIDDLRQQLSALQGRLAPSQRDAADYQRLLRAEQQRVEQERQQHQQEVAELRAQLEQRDSALTLEDVLSEEERDGFDPEMLDRMLKIAQAAATKRAPKIDVKAEVRSAFAEREQQRVQDHRVKVLSDPARGLHQLTDLAHNAKFVEWCKDDDNEVDSILLSLLNAKSTEEVDRYARIVSRKIAKFNEGAKASKTPPPSCTDARTRLAAGMRRNPTPKMTSAEANAKFAEAKRLSRSSNPADRKKAQTLLEDIS